MLLSSELDGDLSLPFQSNSPVENTVATNVPGKKISVTAAMIRMSVLSFRVRIAMRRESEAIWHDALAAAMLRRLSFWPIKEYI